MSDISQWLVDPTPQKEYKYRVLVYPNITYQEDLERDSYVVVIRNVLKYLIEAQPEVYWILLVPRVINSLSLPNVEQRILSLPSYPNTMRIHFDVGRILSVVDWHNEDYDIVYSHLPEHTAQLANVFYNSTNLTPKFVGYCHWFEVPENTAYEKNMLWANLAGLLEMEECGVNSEWLKQFILERFKKMVSKDVIAQLDKTIQPHYLGIDSHNLSLRPDEAHSHVVFNHRPNEYTGWNWFVALMDKLWLKRQDFTVHTTLATVKKPWCQNHNLPTRADYLDFLQGMHFGVGCFEKYSAWSISTTDGLSRGTPYLLPNHLCYPEMVRTDYPLLYSNKVEFERKFLELLDGSVERQKAFESLKQSVPDMMWNSEIEQWFGGWNKVFNLDRYTLRKRTEKYMDILRLIERRGSVSKLDILKYMDWGVSILWSPYRNMLRSDPNIKLTKNRYEIRGI